MKVHFRWPSQRGNLCRAGFPFITSISPTTTQRCWHQREKLKDHSSSVCSLFCHNSLWGTWGGLYLTYCGTCFPSLSAWRPWHKGQLMAIWHNQPPSKLPQIKADNEYEANPPHSPHNNFWVLFNFHGGLKNFLVYFSLFLNFKPNWICADWIFLPSAEFKIELIS